MLIPRPPVVLIASLVVIAANLVSSHCEDPGRRFLKGLDVNAFPTAALFEGSYLQMSSSDTADGFMHETRELAVWLYEDGSWVIQNYNEANYTVRLQKNDVGILMYYDPLLAEDITLPTGNMTFECAPPTLHQCSTNTFRFEDRIFQVPESVAGESFTLERSATNHVRPVFRSDNGLVLSHTQIGWQVSSGPDSSPFLVTLSNATNPAYIDAEWRGVDNDAQGFFEGLQLVCLSALEVEKRESCLHDSMYQKVNRRQYCLCLPGFVGVTCSQKLPACPAHREIPGTVGAYPTIAPDHYPGDIVTLRCKPEMPKSFVRISCHQDEEGEVTWADDVTCERDPPTMPPTSHNMQIYHGTGNMMMANTVFVLVCATFALMLALREQQ